MFRLDIRQPTAAAEGGSDGLSQASPIVSASASFWSGLATLGQLSQASGMPSLSLSVVLLLQLSGDAVTDVAPAIVILVALIRIRLIGTVVAAVADQISVSIGG